ncbi:hypothetical protein AVEN_230697-1 [Araneus ventricosus]|uniref:Uncharacterized protein n=1 Tax=Araneus ventricosus TaxID=182803 RepID=A0A4Y2A1S1_ARAVE|nr:hypothetical protein AVEN_230697-1 [Araneus ventricosus]
MAETKRKPSGISRRCGATNESGLRRMPSGCPGQPSAQYFVDAIRDEDTQHATRLMDATDLKSALAYSMNDSDVGRCNMTQHRINTGNHPPIKKYPRRLPLAKKEEAERLIKEMVDNGIIEESSGP